MVIANKLVSDHFENHLKVIHCADFNEPTSNGCCNTYYINGDEFVANGQVSTGHDIYYNTNTESQIHHMTFYSQYGKWYQSYLTPEEIEANGTIYFANYANSDSLCPPTGLETNWKYGIVPKCKMGGPILTNHCAENNCNVNADCINTMHSFKCACKTGFAGDGLDCTALPVENECENGNNTCDAIGSTCTDTQYSYECQCNTGYWDSDSANPGRSCNGCCSSFQLRYSARYPNWPDWVHGKLWSTCSLNTDNEYNDRYIYDCDTDDQSIFYFLNYPESNYHKLGFEIKFYQ